MTTLRIRQLHAYIGLFVGPSVLFFALTGAVQLFDLHEAHGDYRPFALIEKLSSVHKGQVFAFGDHHVEPGSAPQPANPAADAGSGGQADEDKVSTVLLRWFFLLMALTLILSTALGLWMGLTQTRRKGLAWVLLVAGVLIPVGLLLF
jgi:hypothetical protein